ncbi:MAG: magnesium and cobalt transport protein CorA [Phycisphaeraceae bacterium]|nr:magnesium and cobalt transport protein CorA [Phycisphaeraceae bacterium]
MARKDRSTGLIDSVRSLADDAVGAVSDVGRALTSTLGLPGIWREQKETPHAAPGSRPGLEGIADLDKPPAAGEISIRCMDYSAGRVDVTDVDDLQKFLDQPHPPDGTQRWLNVDGLHPYVVNLLKNAYGFHTLAAEDVLHVPQRPKVEAGDDHLFVVVRMLMLRESVVQAEQVSLFLYRNTLITIQERTGDVWEPIRERLQTEGSRIRAGDVSYLAYALLDAVVDHSFPILEHFGDVLEQLEDDVMASPTPEMQRRIQGIKRQLTLIRRVMWPMREVIDLLYRDENSRFSDVAKTYLRDVSEHSVQVIDVIETYREMANGLGDLYMSAVSNRMNEVMKVLTIMASFFIPITFLAGVYGMNFDAIPELHWKWAYPVFWIICIMVTCALYVFFRRRGWIGK